MREFKLFVDLDGVLVDFDGGVKAVTGALPHHLDKKRMWAILARTPGFYENLDWLSGGKVLWDFLRPHAPTVLTGLPMGSWARPQKLAWCQRELGPEIPVETCLSRDKPKLGSGLTPQGLTPLLIDDRESLMEPWTAMGGVFVLHRETEETIANLRQLWGRR